MNDTKKVLSVQDISCHGQCSNTVILPLLAAAGLETVVLPTALLSTHTGGFAIIISTANKKEHNQAKAQRYRHKPRFHIKSSFYL